MKYIKLTSLIVLFTALPFFTGCGGSGSGGNNTTTDTISPGLVTLLTAVAGDTSISLTWINPSDLDFSGVIIRRSTSPFPVDATGSGTTATGVVIYDGNVNLHLDAGLSNGTTYYYAAFSYDSSGNYSLAEFVSATTSSVGGGITLPGQVTGIIATPANGIVDLAWSNPADADFSGVMICVTQSATAPSSACIPSFVGNGTNSTISGLTNGTLYHFWFFSYDMTYNFTAPVSVSATPIASADTTPPADPTGFAATPGIDRDITFDWFNPANVDFKEVVILRQVGADPVLGFSTEVYRGAGITFTDTELSTGLNYFYGIWAVDTSLNYTAAPVVIGGLTPDDTTPPGPVSVVNVTAGDSSVTLSWTNPSESDFSGVEVRRYTVLAEATDRTLGGLVTYVNKPSTTAIDIFATNGTTYYYGLFAYDNANPVNYAVGVVSGAVTPVAGGM